jgi:putative tryptophan/tyrosine transport system substrate-binding protein
MCYASRRTRISPRRRGEAMRRREFMTLLGGAAAVWPLAARAQQGERVRRIGVLMGFPNDAQGQARITVIRQELSKLGWAEGRNAHMDIRWAAGDPELTQTYATELVRLEPDVIIANSSLGVNALLRETRTVPVIFMAVPDPIGQGFVESLAHPGSNATGFSLIDFPMVAKWLQILKELSPGISRVAFMFNPSSFPGGEAVYRVPFVAAAPSFGIEPRLALVHTRTDVETTLLAIAREPGGGLIIPPDLFTIAHRELIIGLAARHRLPTIYGLSLFATEGGLISYGPEPIDLHRRAVRYVDRILRGERPADLPVQTPTKFELIINLKTAYALGLTVPPNLLALADEVIE